MTRKKSPAQLVKEQARAQIRAQLAAHPPETRGRPLQQDAEEAALGRIPASRAAALAGRHISRLYRARDAGRLPMTLRGTYWYVALSDLEAFVGRKLSP